MYDGINWVHMSGRGRLHWPPTPPGWPSYLEALVAGPERAVGAVVDAVVGQVQRREQHDAVAVDAVLDGEGGVVHHVQQRRVVDVDVEEGGALLYRQALDVLGRPCRSSQLWSGQSPLSRAKAADVDNTALATCGYSEQVPPQSTAQAL
jgi:hypothetical protein